MKKSTTEFNAEVSCDLTPEEKALVVVRQALDQYLEGDPPGQVRVLGLLFDKATNAAAEAQQAKMLKLLTTLLQQAKNAGVPMQVPPDLFSNMN